MNALNTSWMMTVDHAYAYASYLTRVTVEDARDLITEQLQRFADLPVPQSPADTQSRAEQLHAFNARVRLISYASQMSRLRPGIREEAFAEVRRAMEYPFPVDCHETEIEQVRCRLATNEIRQMADLDGINRRALLPTS